MLTYVDLVLKGVRKIEEIDPFDAVTQRKKNRQKQ